MKRVILVLVGALGLVACGHRAAAPVGTTQTTGANIQAPSTIEQIRETLIKARPEARDAINAMIITDDNGVVTLRGNVLDEATKDALVDRVLGMQNVHGVVDELKVPERQAKGPAAKTSTTTTTGATMGNQAPTAMSKSDSVRVSMMKAHPKSKPVIQALQISDDGQTVTLSGTVPDEATHQALLKTAKDTPGVKNVKDDLKVEPPKR